MKKIVQFNKVLKFDNEVNEIKSISLEHNINNTCDMISGEFVVSGNYIIKDNISTEEKFKFVLPFDIALGINYKEDTMVIDIDDFRYELLDNNKLRVDIDLYILGEEQNDEDNGIIFDEIEKESLREEENEDMENELEIDNNNININDNLNVEDDNTHNIFSPFLDDETYVTYRVYTVMEGDTIDSILEKYNISMEEMMKYNDISNLKPMDKLIIPSNEK